MNDFIRGNPFLVQSKQQMATSADCRNGGNSSALSADPRFGSLSPRRPRLAQERRQGNVRLVLKIQNRPVFPHGFADFWQFACQPFQACSVVRLEVLTFWFLVGEPRFPKPSPNRVLGDGDLQFLLNDLMDPRHSPQVCFIPNTGCRLKNDLPQLFAVQLRQLAWTPASRSPVQAVFSLLPIPLDPTKECRAIRTVSLRHLSDGKAMKKDSLHGANPNIVGRVPSLAHGGRLSRQVPCVSRSMLQIYCGEPYDD